MDVRPSFGFTPIYHTDPAEKRYQRGGAPRLDTPMIAAEWFVESEDYILVVLYKPHRGWWIEGWNHKRNQWENRDAPRWATPMVEQFLNALQLPDQLFT